MNLRLQQLKIACERHDVDFISINSQSADYSNLPKLNNADLLYNSTRGSETLETLLLNQNRNVKTFYIRNPELVTLNSDTTKYSIIHERENLQSPKTIFSVSPDRDLLKRYVKYLNGFPVILKATGSTRGIGTIKIDSWENLISTVDYISSTGEKFILRQFINAKSGFRLIVLGDKVIAGAEFIMNENDFRNAVDLKQVKYLNREFPENVNETAVKATHLVNTEFSGVDFLEDEKGDFYLLEINFPTGFSGLIDVCNADIPFKMVEHLLNKTNKDINILH